MAIAAQVIPVLEQQMRDVQEDLRNQEGVAKELTDQVKTYAMTPKRDERCLILALSLALTLAGESSRNVR